MPRKYSINFDIRNDIPEFFMWARYRLEQVIPPDFSWVFEMHSDISMRVRWRWNAKPGVEKVGATEDCEFGILEALLRSEDWDAHRREAIAAIDAAECALLHTAQARRARLWLLPTSASEGEAVAALPDGLTARPAVAAGTGLPGGFKHARIPNHRPAASRE